MGSYAYEELKPGQIRLAVLHPGAGQDPIRLAIEHVDLIAAGPRRQPTLPRIQKELPADWKAHEEQPKQLFFQRRNTRGQWEQPQWSHPDPNFDSRPYQRLPNPLSYEALSYTWGSEANAERAHIVPNAAGTHDLPESSTLPLGRNLADALRDLRYDDRPRTLWVDAICINQDNPAELGVQVARAGTVYEEARRVVIWLGRESPDSSLAMRALDHLGSQVMVSAAHVLLAHPGATETGWHLPAVTLPYDSKTWAAIDSLLRRRWFTRVWIQQEVHLADEAVFLCGHEQVSREKFWRATRTMQSKVQLDPAIARSVLTATMRALLPLRSSCTIFHITGRTWNGQCKDPRDYVYGALGLFPPSFRAKITIDYRLSSAKVYTDFVTQHIKHVRRLEMLRLCDLAARGPDVPSWVPDFSSRSSPNTMLGSWHFSAGHSACDAEFRGLTLEAVGVEADMVQSLSEVIPLRTGKPDGSFEAAVGAVRRIIAAFQAEHAGTELGSRPENFAWALLGTFLHDRLPENLIGKREDMQHIMRHSGIFGSGKSENLVEGRLSFPEDQCLDLLSGRRVARTKGGLMGIVPGAAEEGKQQHPSDEIKEDIKLTPPRRHYRLLPRLRMPYCPAPSRRRLPRRRRVFDARPR